LGKREEDWLSLKYELEWKIITSKAAFKTIITHDKAKLFL
jgi:hypothetical protein